jgi:hypothetical protein
VSESDEPSQPAPARRAADSAELHKTFLRYLNRGVDSDSIFADLADRLDVLLDATVKPWRDRLGAVHKSGACGGSYSDGDRRWCDCGYLTLRGDQ